MYDIYTYIYMYICKHIHTLYIILCKARESWYLRTKNVLSTLLEWVQPQTRNCLSFGKNFATIPKGALCKYSVR